MIKLCVAFGGRSSEYEVSCNSAYAVIKNIDKTKYVLTLVGITKDGVWYHYTGSVEKIADGSWAEEKESLTPCRLPQSYGDHAIYTDTARIPIDVFFPMMHGANCEDGKLQGALTLCGIPFVGSGCTASAVAMDKAFTKQIIRGEGIPQAEALVFSRRELMADLHSAVLKITEKFDFPVFVKPANTGSSVGVSKAKTKDELEAALLSASECDNKVLVEEYISGGEFEVAVIGNDAPVASCVGEIDPGSDFYDYNTKYIDDTALYFIPARLSPEISDKVREYAVKIYTTLGCRGLSRVDFFVEGDRIIFNEINTLPGFTPISMYPKLQIHGGLTYSQLIDRLIELAQEKE